MKGRRIDLGEEEKETKKGSKKVTPPSVEEKKPVSSADEFLASVGINVTPKPANGKKNGIQSLNPSAPVKIVVDELVTWKKTKKEAEAEIATREATIIDYVQPIQEKDGFAGDYQKSYYVPGAKETVTFVSADKFTPPKDEDIPVLQDALGDRFSEFLKKETTISLKSGVLSDPKLLEELRTALPDFGKFFDATQRWVVLDGFDKKRFSLPKRIFDKVVDIIKQAKPSLR